MEFIKKAKEFLLNFFNLTRTLSNVKNIAIVLLSFYLSGTSFNWYKLVTGIISLSFISSAVYIYNNLSDEKIDIYNKNKNHYSKSVRYFGEKNTLVLLAAFLIFGIYFGSFINLYFLTALLALFITGFLYSFKHTRFKEKIILDVLFGATLTFFFRFAAAWFIFSISMPPFLAVTALIFAKSAGYMLYKEADRPYLLALKVKNSITFFNKKTILIISSLLWIISFSSFILLCLNSLYFKKFLLLLPFGIPPLAGIYFLALGKIKTQIKHLRIIGFCYWILVIIIIWALFL